MRDALQELADHGISAYEVCLALMPRVSSAMREVEQAKRFLDRLSQAADDYPKDSKAQLSALDGSDRWARAVRGLSGAVSDTAKELRLCEDSGKKRVKKMTYAQKADELLEGLASWPTDVRRYIMKGLRALDPQELREAMP